MRIAEGALKLQIRRRRLRHVARWSVFLAGVPWGISVVSFLWSHSPMWSVQFGSRAILHFVEFDGFAAASRRAIVREPAQIIVRRVEFCVGGQVFLLRHVA